MRILAIETSGRIGSVALLEAEGDADQLVCQRHTPQGERTAQSLLPTIQQLLHEKGWRPAELELICVTTGPGSFTGLRIGVVAAKTLAYATGAPLVGVHTLAAIAAGVDAAAPRLWTMLDAQRQELFVSSFDCGEPLAKQPSPETAILSLPLWLERVAAGDAVAGPPLAQCRKQLPVSLKVVDDALWQPTAAALARLGLQLFQQGGPIDPLKLVPQYYRKSAAEEKAKS